MKNKINILFIIFLLNSCNNEATESSLDTLKTETSSSLGTKKAPKAAPMEKGILRPFSFTLNGTLGDEHPIEMYLTYDPLDLHKDDNNHCIEILGDYSYTDQQASSFKLCGEFCFDMGIATLHHKEGKQIIKSFKGKFDGQVHSIQGKWTHNKTQEHRVFELVNNSNKIQQQTLERFAQKLHEHLKHSTKCQVDKVGFDEKGIFIENLTAKNLLVKAFSPTQFKWKTSQESDGGSFDYDETVDLWFYDNNDNYVILINTMDYTENNDHKGQLIEEEKQLIEVWKYNGLEFKNIYLEQPDKVDLSTMPWYATFTNNKIQLYSNKDDGLWEWN